MRLLKLNLKSGADQKSMTHFVTLGGTIVSSHTNQGVRPTQNPENVIKECLHPDIVETIEVHKLKNTLSAYLNIKEFFEINRMLHEASQKPNTRAIIILTGTDNLENIVFFINLLTSADTLPIIFTGAITPYGQWRSDAFKNINDSYYESFRLEKSAMKIAAVFDGETLSAAGVRKIDTDNPKAFTDTMKNSNPLSIQKIIKEKDYFINVPQIIFPKIRTISVVTGADMTAISSAVNDGSQIVILDAFGKGNINLEATEEIKQNSDKTIFIITSRVLYGNAEPVYTPAKLAKTHGVLFAGRLSLEKTVLLSGLFVSQPHVQALDFKKRKRELQKALDLANQ